MDPVEKHQICDQKEDKRPQLSTEYPGKMRVDSVQIWCLCPPQLGILAPGHQRLVWSLPEKVHMFLHVMFMSQNL